MWTISQIVCIAGLTCASVADVYSRKIPVCVLVLANVAAVGYQIAVKKDDIWLIIGGIGIGILFLLLGKATHESIGYGDGWAILILGIYLGVWQLLEMLTVAFILLVVASVFCLVWKKMSRKMTIPFYPFLAAGYLVCLISGGGAV